MKPVQELLAKYKISFKTAVAVWTIAVGTFYSNDAFHAFAVGAYGHVPAAVKAAIVGLGPLVVALYKARKELAPAEPPASNTLEQFPLPPVPAAPATK